MLKNSSILVLLAAMLILAACSAANKVPRIIGSAADEAPRIIGGVADEAPRVLGSAADEAPRIIGGAADEAPRVLGSAADEVPEVAGTTMKEIIPSGGAAVDSLTLQLAQDEIARIIGDQADFLLLQQQATEVSREQRKLQVQEGLEKALCTYLNPSKPQEAARLRIAQIAAEVYVPEPDLFAWVNAVHQVVSNEEELTNLFKLYCEAKELR